MANVAKISYCESCDSPMLRGKACKKCFPETSRDEKQKINYACVFVENGQRCCSKLNSVRITKPNEIDQFWCSKHYEKFRPKNEINFGIDQGADAFRSLKEKSMVSWSRFFREYYGYEFKDAAKNLSATK
jgi:hypothetical protein